MKINGLLRSWTYPLQDLSQSEKCIRSFFWSVFSCIQTMFNLQPTYFKWNALTHWTALTLKQAAIVVYSPSDILLAAHIRPCKFSFRHQLRQSLWFFNLSFSMTFNAFDFPYLVNTVQYLPWDHIECVSEFW